MAKLQWECLHEERCFRAPAPLFGSIRVERFSLADKWEVLWSVPGYCATLIEGEWPNADAAKEVAETHVKAACAALSN